ncbi:MAG: TraB/GumN family protein [Sphingomonadaceae bacterium]|nr:TraB/GumN family protein [Sphingomonadaceae bacterium]
MSRRAYLAPLLAAAFFSAPALAQTAAPKPAAATTAGKPVGKPALWVVKDADTTIYLFGTFHLYNGRTNWFTGKVRDAFDRSNEVIFEIDPTAATANQPAFGALVQRYGMRPVDAPPLSKVAGVDLPALERERKGTGLSQQALDRMQPWLAALTFSLVTPQKMGLTGEQGAERVIARAAVSAKKRIGELETAEGQIRLLSGLSEPVQIQLLNSTLAESGRSRAMYDRMIAAWEAGDVNTLSKLLNESLDHYPALQKALITDRNARWAKAIETMLKKPGSVMVAVGSGHVSGAGSVQELLRKDGVTAVRLQ